MKKIFISYSRTHDSENAEKMYNALASYPENFDVWLDTKSLAPGLEWKPAVIKEIRDTDYFIAVLSPGSVSIKKGMLNYEINEALEVLKEFVPTEVYIIPARVDNCMPSFEQLKKLNFVDLFPDWNAGMQKLITSLDKNIGSLTVLGTNVKNLNAVYSAELGQIKNNFRKNEKTQQKKAGKEHHYKVGLVDLDIGLKNLKKVITQLNKVQNYFEFTLPEMAPLKNKVQKMDGVKNFNVSKVTKAYIKKNKNIDTDFIVNMTAYPLTFEEDGMIYYNYFAGPSDYDERFFFISADQLKEFSKTAGTEYEEGLVYMLIGQLISYFTKLGYHKATRGCVMDHCANRVDIVKGFKNRKLCPQCNKKMPEGDFKKAINSLLKWKYK